MQTHVAGKQNCKVFIGGLSWETTDEKLRRYFENFGTVLEAFVSYDRNSGRPRGFGFVLFEDSSVADKVVSLQHTIDRREVEAKKAVPKDDSTAPRHTNGMAQQRTKKIFVGGLAPTVDESAFRHYFEAYGPVEDAVVMYDHDNKRPRGFGFVTFVSEDSVDKVLGNGQMQTLHDKQIEIKRAVPKDQMPPARTRTAFSSPTRTMPPSRPLDHALHFQPALTEGISSVNLNGDNVDTNTCVSLGCAAGNGVTRVGGLLPGINTGVPSSIGNFGMNIPSALTSGNSILRSTAFNASAPSLSGSLGSTLNGAWHGALGASGGNAIGGSYGALSSSVGNGFGYSLQQNLGSAPSLSSSFERTLSGTLAASMGATLPLGAYQHIDQQIFQGLAGYGRDIGTGFNSVSSSTSNSLVETTLGVNW